MTAARPLVISERPFARVVTLNNMGDPRSLYADKREWRDGVERVARSLMHRERRPRPAFMERVSVEVSFPVKSLEVRRDPRNWSITTKWIIDGLTKAGVIDDDDGARLVELPPSFHLVSRNPCFVVVVEPAGGPIEQHAWCNTCHLMLIPGTGLERHLSDGHDVRAVEFTHPVSL